MVDDSPKKYYSRIAIAIATYFGGPIAAGILARRNFINMGKNKFATYSIPVGIVSTFLVFVLIFSVPENILDKIPNSLIPTVYTAIIYAFIDWLQGPTLKSHKENNGTFYSLWKALGVGIMCLAILLGILFSYFYFFSDDFDTNKYESEIAQVNQNEEKALELYDLIDMGDVQVCVRFIDSVGLPAWKANIQILAAMDTIEGLYDEFILQDKILENYNLLRIQSYEWIRKSLVENTHIYDHVIDSLDLKMAKEIQKLE